MTKPIRPIPSIAALWDEYRTRVIAADAPDIQVSECRLAFYGACLKLMLVLRNDVSELSENAACAVLESMLQECAEFAKGVKR